LNRTTDLSRPRYLLINTLILVIIAGSLFDVVTRKEHWPFSPYDLYSGVSRHYSLTLLRLYGVLEAEPFREIPLYAYRYIQPFDNARLRFALETMDVDPERVPELTEALRDCLRRYEALRAVGRHNGPSLRGMRLYRVDWKLDPWARNLEFPDRKQLLFEISQPPKGKS
jgi:hypothetical protein